MSSSGFEVLARMSSCGFEVLARKSSSGFTNPDGIIFRI
jgi:hypothetical protein